MSSIRASCISKQMRTLPLPSGLTPVAPDNFFPQGSTGKKVSSSIWVICRRLMEVAAAATEHGWGRRKAQGARGLLHISQIGAIDVKGTSTVCVAQMMLGRSLQVCHPPTTPSTLPSHYTIQKKEGENEKRVGERTTGERGTCVAGPQRFVGWPGGPHPLC